MQKILTDCRHAVRLYARTPGASLIAIAALAVGMAFTLALLSLYVDLILRPHPGFEQGAGVATIRQSDGTRSAGVPYRIVERMSSELTSIESAAMSSARIFFLGSDREQVTSELISRDFFPTLRPRIVLGRGFRLEDHSPDAEPVAIISSRFWRERFGSSPNALGTLLDVSRSDLVTAQLRIVGVMSPKLPGLEYPDTSIWIPLERAIPLFDSDDLPEVVREQLPDVLGASYVRLRSGASVAAFVEEFRIRYLGSDALFALLPSMKLDAIAGIVRDIDVHRAAMRHLKLFLAGSVLLAIVAAANVSLFLLARAPSRRREVGIRMSVGASIGRIARQLATEAGLLVIAAGSLGLLLSVWLSAAFTDLEYLERAEWHDVTLLDWRVICLASAVLLILGLLLSLAPIASIRKFSIADVSRQTTASTSLNQYLIISIQICVAGALGGAAVAFAWYLGSLIFAYPGYETTDRFMVENVAAHPSGGTSDTYQIELARRREAIEGIPGVSAVAFGSPIPGNERTFTIPASVPNPSDPANTVVFYFGTLERQFAEMLGFELILGRIPEAGDANVVVVNQSLAHEIWGRDDVIGEHLPRHYLWGPEGAEIIGVLRDFSYSHPSAAIRPVVFTTQGSPGTTEIAVIEAELSAAELKQALDRLVIDGTLEADVGNVIPLKAMRNRLIASDRTRSMLTIMAAVIVVLLVAGGFYGTQRYLVSLGRREYAIRLALGAGPQAVRRLVLGRALQLGSFGLLAGTLFAYIICAWLKNEYLAQTVSPSVISLGLTIGLAIILLAAAAGPAREAGRTLPAPLLRDD